ESSRRAVFAVWGLVTAASAALVGALLTDDFRFAYVASHSNRSLAAAYKFAAWWGGQEGSLLLWNWVLSGYAALVLLGRRARGAMMPWVTATLMATQCFFLLLNTFLASPFQVLAVGRGITAAPDGTGLNPLLQHWAMIIHPPILYLGYVGFTVPFAFAIASLVTRQPGNEWLHLTRRWTIVTWLFHSAGILLGAAWAYAVLGWGGYWGWDPVENASLLPWLTATAFLHSVMMQERRGMMKIWNVALISCTFLLSILGTFLTRSGVVSSVHAFGKSPLGNYFLAFLVIGIAVTTYLILSRLEYLRPEARLESVVSRESSFLLNGLMLLLICFAVLWGTLYPLFSEIFTGQKVTVGPPYFNRVNIPAGLFLLLLTGLGPLVAWRRASLDSLRRNFLWPLAAAAVLAAGLLAAGVRHAYALASFGLCLFVLWTIVSEFYLGARAVRARTGQGLAAAAVELSRRNTRRYGGYIVHLGVVLMFLGFTGSAFNQEATVELKPAGQARIGQYELRLAGVRPGDNANYAAQTAVVEVSRNGRSLGGLRPERRFYKAGGQTTSEVAIRRGLIEDLYLNFAGLSDDDQRAVLQAYVFPLVSWIWIGSVVLGLGACICLIPSAKPRAARAGPK
ncbi:MAG: heme lyase CcmF/NrfE family subunit, partial [Acidobacteria bacterium]|nr:heme lyase CcmF/NrfE family subunit [Acidobacteriota bacterium]